MASTGNILLGVMAVAGVGYGIYTYDQKHKGQQMGNMRLKVLSVNLQDGDIVMSVLIQNPNSQNMAVQSFVGDMLVNDNKVANIKMFGDYVAKGNTEITIPLVIKPNQQNLFTQMMGLFKNGGARIKFVGTINVNNNAIPLILSYTK